MTLAKDKLASSRLKPIDIVVNEWSAVVEAGTPFDVVKDEPLFWAHIAKLLRGGDVIHVRCDDDAYYARLYVRAVRGTAVTVAVLEFHDFTKMDAVEADTETDFRVEWAGPHHKWRVVRQSDNVPVHTGLDSKAVGMQVMAGLAKQRAA